MAEYVEQRLEKTIAELEELKHLKLFTDLEVGKLISRRREFEYKIQRHGAEKCNFLTYIEFEVNLLQDIHLRRLKLCVEKKKYDIETPIISRVFKLYELCLRKFKNDSDIWLSVIKFGTSVGYVERVAEIITHMLEANPTKPELWKAATVWHMNQGSLNDAESLILKGLQHNPDNDELYIQAFKIELELIKAKQSKKEDDDELKFKRALTVFESFLKFKPKIEVLCDLFNVVDDYEPQSYLLFQIINILQNKFPNEEYFWHTLALRELAGKHYMACWEPSDKEISPANRIKNACAVYKAATEQIPTAKMWSYYLDTILNHPGLSTEVQYEILKDVFCNNSKFLLESHYLSMVELADDPQEQEMVLLTAKNQYPKSVAIWCELVCLYIRTGDVNIEVFSAEDKVKPAFEEGVQILKDEALPLWQIALKYLMLPRATVTDAQKAEKINALYLQGIKLSYPQIADQLKIDYIKWLAFEKDFVEARKAFARIITEDEKSTSRRPKLEFIKQMIELESVPLKPNKGVIKALMEKMKFYYGKDNIDVWLDLIKFQMKDCPQQVGLTYNSAKRTLLSRYHSEFDIKYRLLQVNNV